MMKVGSLNRSIGSKSKIGCVLGLDFTHLDGASFMSNGDCFGHLCTNYGSKWQLDGGYFDGTGVYLQCPHHAVLQPPPLGELTIEVAVRQEGNVANINPIVSKSIANNDAYNYIIQDESQKPAIECNHAGTWWVANTPLTLNKLTPIAVSAKGRGHRIFYKDGNLDKYHAGNNVAAEEFQQNTEPVRIGKSRWASPNFLLGVISSVRLYASTEFAGRILERAIEARRN